MQPTHAKHVLQAPTRPTVLLKVAPLASQAMFALDRLTQHSQLLLTTTVGIFVQREPIVQQEVHKRVSAHQEPTILKKESKARKSADCVKPVLSLQSGAQLDVSHAASLLTLLRDLLSASVRGSIELTQLSMLLADARVVTTSLLTESVKET